MGGRGAASGISVKGIKYGDEYHTVLKYKNVKFIRYNIEGSLTSPMETRTPGRIYVLVRPDNKLKSIVLFDKNNKRNRQIDLDHIHKVNGKGYQPHTHLGYFHDENGTRPTNRVEDKAIAKLKKIWDNHNRK